MVHEVSSVEEFNEYIESGSLVVVDFYAQWCGPCKRIAPALDQLAEEFPDVKFIKVDVDSLNDLVSIFGIKGMPTFIIFKDVSSVDQLVGANIPKLREMIQKHM